MKHRYIYIIATLLIIGVTTLQSAEISDTTSILSSLNSETLQTSQDVRPRTLKECLEKGLQKNYSLRIIRNEEQMAANNATMENASSTMRSCNSRTPEECLVCIKRHNVTG